ncbi:MAG: GAF domain-containing protein [Anaerolineae bacterium]|nr:GAF domain-containing protein [Anaerolineae bacterium]
MTAIRYPYQTNQERQQAVVISIVSLIFGIVGPIGTLLLYFFSPGIMPSGLLLPNLILSAAYLGIYALVQTGSLNWTRYLFILLTTAVPTVQGLPGTFLSLEAMAAFYTFTILASSLLLGASWTLVTVALTISLVVLRASLQAIPFQTTFIAALALLTIGLLSWLSSGTIYTWIASQQRRLRLLESAFIVSETATTAPSTKSLLNEVVDQILETYEFYHAQVFLVDAEQRMARLEASTGRAGEALLARGHALAIGSQSVVGQCTSTGKPVVVNNTRESPVHRPNKLLPDTQAELALPLVVGDTVIGALDVQSTQLGAFQPEDIRFLQTMAAQLAAAIDKARVVEELEIRAEENERLFEEAQRTLLQFEELNRRLTREGWSDYLHGRRMSNLGYTLLGENLRANAEWSAPMRQAYKGESSVVIRQDQQAHIAAVPVRIRNEVVGVIEIERGGDHPWKDIELEMIETLVDRLGLAIENARLYEQATQATQREQIINQISQDVQGASSIDEVLQSALAELSQVLGASRGVVQISPKDQPAPGTVEPRPLPEHGR